MSILEKMNNALAQKDEALLKEKKVEQWNFKDEF